MSSLDNDNGISASDVPIDKLQPPCLVRNRAIKPNKLKRSASQTLQKPSLTRQINHFLPSLLYCVSIQEENEETSEK